MVARKVSGGTGEGRLCSHLPAKLHRTNVFAAMALAAYTGYASTWRVVLVLASHSGQSVVDGYCPPVSVVFPPRARTQALLFFHPPLPPSPPGAED